MTSGDRTIETIQQSIGWITRQRWFGDKARRVISAGVEHAETVTHGQDATTLAVVRFSFDWGADALYFVPFEVRDGAIGEGLSDALGQPSFLQWFIDGFADARSIGSGTKWSWREIGEGLPDPESVNYANARAISGEQSNTSIVFDRRFIGKVFRRVQVGLNPDLEIGEFLSANNRFAHAPKLYGVVEIELDGDVLAVAAMQEFVPNRGDGWTWLLNALRDSSAGWQESTLDAVKLLARRTGELHVALASDPGNPAFMPEEFTGEDASALIGRVIAEINESVEGLAAHIPPHEVELIHKRMGDMMGVAHRMVGTRKIRVHGDYHLGQTLRTVDDDFVLIDFEGEPSRTMEQRRMKLPALKDVAGMVRSLDYAAATIIQDEEDPERRAEIGEWLNLATDAYVQSYRETVQSASVEIIPSDDAMFTDVLNLMIAEKALYEVRYEMNNRPAWLSIPLNALRRLAGVDDPAGID